MADPGGGLIGRMRGMPSSAWRLVALGTFIALANGIFGFAFVLFLHDLGHGTAVQGALLSLMEVAVALTVLPFGMLVPRVGKRYMLLAGVGAMASAYVLVATARESWQFAPGMLLLGLGTSLTTPTLAAALADTVSDRDRKYLLSLNAFCILLASALGFFLAGVLVQMMGEEGGFRALFLLAGLAVLPGALLTGRLADAGRPSAPGARGGARKILSFVLPQFVLGLGAGLVIPFFPVYFKLRFDASTALISGLFTATQLIWALTYIGMPVLAERKGSVRTLILMQSAAVVALFSIPLATTFEMTAGLFAFRMIFMNASRPLADSYMMTLVGKDLRSTAVAANQMAWMVPHMLSVAAGGVLMTASLELPFVLCGLLYIASTALYAHFFWNRDDALPGNGSKPN